MEKIKEKIIETFIPKQLSKEEIKLFMFKYDMILYVENTKESTHTCSYQS